jgi:pimeloyl-ACP methyl ester carboxylesterase
MVPVEDSSSRDPAPPAVFYQKVPDWIKGPMGVLGRVAPGLAGRVAADLFMRPFRPRPHSREQEWLRDARPETLPTRCGKLAGWSWGNGPAVVLVHGWNGRGSQMGRLARTIAARGFHALVFDGPAHGRSPGRRTSLIKHSAALVDIAASLPEFYGVVGHSFGALAISYRWNELPSPRRLVMISPPAEMKLYSRMFIRAIGGTDEIHDRMVGVYRKKFGIIWDDITVENLAPKIAPPLLVVHDRADRQAPLSHGRRTCRAWSGSRLHATEGLGHHRILRDAAVAEVVADFMVDEATAGRT